MPTKTRKDVQPAAAPVTAAEAAAAEAAGAPVEFEFRGQEFSIPRDIVESARVRAVLARGSIFDVIRELLAGDVQNFDRFLSVVKIGEPDDAPINEFFAAFDAAAGLGNSETS